MTITQKTRPLFPYVGGKGRYYERVIKFVPDKRSIHGYFEPFCGGAGFAIAMYDNGLLTPDQIHLNDLNTDIINMYRMLQITPFAFTSLLNTRYTQENYDETKRRYLANDYNGDDLLRAITCFIMYKTTFQNNKLFSTPNSVNMDTRKIDTIIHRDWVYATSMFLHKVRLTELDYSVFLEKCEEGDFVFLDPPYDTNQISYINGRSDSFNQEALVEVLLKLTKKKVRFLMVLNDTERVRITFKMFRITPLVGQGSFHGNKKKDELVVRNYEDRNSLLPTYGLPNMVEEKVEELHIYRVPEQVDSDSDSDSDSELSNGLPEHLDPDSDEELPKELSALDLEQEVQRKWRKLRLSVGHISNPDLLVEEAVQIREHDEAEAERLRAEAERLRQEEERLRQDEERLRQEEATRWTCPICGRVTHKRKQSGDLSLNSVKHLAKCEHEAQSVEPPPPIPRNNNDQHQHQQQL